MDTRRGEDEAARGALEKIELRPDGNNDFLEDLPPEEGRREFRATLLVRRLQHEEAGIKASSLLSVVNFVSITPSNCTIFRDSLIMCFIDVVYFCYLACPHPLFVIVVCFAYFAFMLSFTMFAYVIYVACSQWPFYYCLCFAHVQFLQ